MYEFNYKDRLARYQQVLRTEGTDYAVLTQPRHIRYLSGFWGYAARAEYFEPGRLTCLVVPETGTPLLVIPKIERSFAEVATRRVPLIIEHHVEWSSKEDATDAWELVRRFVTTGTAANPTISIEKAQLHEKAYQPFLEKFDGALIIDGSATIERLQAVKDEVELKLLRASGQLAASMFQVELDAVRRGGMRECDVVMIGLEHNMRACAELIEQEDQENLFVDSPVPGVAQLLTSGPRLNRAHGVASTRPIGRTDLVAIDFCRVPFLLGYRIGFGRVVAQRPLDSSEQDINATVKKSYDLGVSMCRPGVVVSEIDVAVRTVLEEGGLGQYVMHRTGRTLGSEPIDIPISEGNMTKLENDMVLSLEPSVYMDSFQSRIESTFRITPNGPELLTPVAEEMISV